MEEQDDDKKEKWVDGATNLIELYKDLISIRIVEYTSFGASVSAFGILSLIFVVFILLFLSVGLAWWLGESMENIKAGFLIVGAGYTAIFIVLMLTAKKVIVPGIRNLIIKKIYEQD